MSTFAKPADWPVTEVWIETGTHRGESVAAALAAGYRDVRSVEFDYTLLTEALRRFDGDDRVKLYHGSSPLILPSMITPQQPTTFWLDAHFSGVDIHEQDPAYGECPLLAELDVITSFDWLTPPLIMIDDAHLFAGNAGVQNCYNVFDPRLNPAAWPTLAQIAAALPHYAITACPAGALICTVPR